MTSVLLYFLMGAFTAFVLERYGGKGTVPQWIALIALWPAAHIYLIVKVARTIIAEIRKERS